MGSRGKENNCVRRWAGDKNSLKEISTPGPGMWAPDFPAVLAGTEATEVAWTGNTSGNLPQKKFFRGFRQTACGGTVATCRRPAYMLSSKSTATW